MKEKNFIILNGSPKGNQSVTLQNCRYIAKKFPQYSFKVYHVVQKIKRLEKEPEKIIELKELVSNSNGIIWSFPLYVGSVHSDLMRFIEIIFESEKLKEAFSKKYTIALSTSIHFYDHIVHKYIHEICDDLMMNYVGYYSAEMRDLNNPESEKKKNREKVEKTNLQTRKNLEHLFKRLLYAIDAKLPISYRVSKLREKSSFVYIPSPEFTFKKIQNPSITILTDHPLDDMSNQDVSVQNMVKRVSEYCQNEPKVYNLRELNIKGSCQGCCHCGIENKCIYGDSDDHYQFYETVFKPANIIIFAFPIIHHYFSSYFKRIQDRGFYNTHIPIRKSKQLAYIVSGSLSNNPNLIRLMRGRNEVSRANVVGFVSDESNDSFTIDQLLYNLIDNVVESEKNGIINPPSMLGLGGIKIFRDDIYGKLSFPFVGDYKYYKENGLFEFPKPSRNNKFLTFLCRFEKIGSKIKQSLKEKMVASQKSFVDGMEGTSDNFVSI